MSKDTNMAMVLQALKNAGLSDNQARILGAEIGRENAFEDKWLWGYHKDPKNGAVNIGIISWQGDRGKGVERALRAAGLIQNGKIVKGQASLDVMAKYLVNEITTNPKYAATKKQFLDNPNVDYHTGTKVLGKNFIRWRYDDPKYASGHTNRDSFYKKLGGIIPQAGDTMQADNQTTVSQPSTDLSMPMFQVPQILPTGQVPTLPVDLFGGVVNQGNLGLNLDLMATLQNMNSVEQPNNYMMSAPLFSYTGY